MYSKLKRKETVKYPRKRNGKAILVIQPEIQEIVYFHPAYIKLPKYYKLQFTVIQNHNITNLWPHTLS